MDVQETTYTAYVDWQTGTLRVKKSEKGGETLEVGIPLDDWEDDFARLAEKYREMVYDVTNACRDAKVRRNPCGRMTEFELALPYLEKVTAFGEKELRSTKKMQVGQHFYWFGGKELKVRVVFIYELFDFSGNPYVEKSVLVTESRWFPRDEWLSDTKTQKKICVLVKDLFLTERECFEHGGEKMLADLSKS